MSLGKRLWDVARANITDFGDALTGRESDGLSAEERAELEEELRNSFGARAGRRARSFVADAESAWEEAYEEAKRRAAPGGLAPDEMASYYRTLELEPGADLAEVRKAYRRLLRKYHPDRFATQPDKLEAANEIARRITEAYNGLRQALDAQSGP